MNDLGQAFNIALGLILDLNPDLFEIVTLSLLVSGSAVIFACLIGCPLGAMLAIARFPGRTLIIVINSTLMGLPPVVAGLLVYMALSQAGPLAVLELLYTPTAMIIAQTLLVTPIVASLTLATIQELDTEYRDLLKVMRASLWQRISTLLWDARNALVVAALAGFGRALAEVGAVMIVGGNINHFTRVMTSAITLHTSRGDFAFALALGLILLVLALIINLAIWLAKGRLQAGYHA